MAHTLSLLIADDEPLAAMALRSQLEAMGHRVAAHARDGNHAVELARCFLVDLAILDFRMPAMTGLEAANAIFDIRPMPILVLSGFPEEEDDAPRPPAYHYLVKPADVADLNEGIRLAIEHFQQWKQRQNDPDRLQRFDDEARLVDQARRLLARNARCSQRSACRQLLDRAERERRTVPDMARHILQNAT